MKYNLFPKTKEFKIKVIVFCYIAYGIFVILGTFGNIIMGIDCFVWGKMAQGFSLFAIAIAIYRKPKGQWWYIFLTASYVSIGWLIGFGKVLPKSFSAPQIFYPTLLFMIIPLVLIFTKDLKKELS